jgi:DNA-binding beta-propeller fold protein YncE
MRPLARRAGHRLSLARLPLVLAVIASVAVALQPLAAPAVRAEDEPHAARLVVADPSANRLLVLDAHSATPLATFDTPGAPTNLVASPGGRWVYALQTQTSSLSIVDTGLHREDHGDHQDLDVTAPSLRGTVTPGQKPIDFWAGNGVATVHNDDDATLAIFDEERLAESLEFTLLKGAGTGHNNAVVLGDIVLLSLVTEGKITAYDRVTGAPGRTFEGCPGTHGWTTKGVSFAAVGCTDGVMLFTKDGAEIRAHKVEEPLLSPANARVSTLASHRDSAVLVGNFGQGLALIRPDTATLDAVPLPANPLRFHFTHDGDRVIVLTADGKVHGVDPAGGQVVWSTEAVTPFDAQAGGPRPSMAVGEDIAYVSDPPRGSLVMINLAAGALEGGPIAVGGTPTAIVLAAAEGIQH